MAKGRITRWRDRRALKALADSDLPAIAAYAKADWPSHDVLARDADYLALDFELDGLRKDAHLLQVGWLPFAGKRIGMGEAHSIDIRSYAQLDGEAVTIHGIGEQRAAQGEPVAEVITQLISTLAGRVMVAHAAGIEQHAIQRNALKLFGARIPVRQICTLTLERQINPNLVGNEVYRLANSRKRYGLPDYRGHDALTDAIAAAELFQAQLTRLPADITLGQIETG